MPLVTGTVLGEKMCTSVIYQPSDCTQLLTNLDGGELPPYEVIEVDPLTDPVYGVAEESSVYANVQVAKA
jgi:hypothetical protein